jgi:hypothetical protein
MSTRHKYDILLFGGLAEDFRAQLLMPGVPEQKVPPGQIALAFHEVCNFKLTEALAKVVTPVKTGVQECLNLVGVTGFRRLLSRTPIRGSPE